MPVGLTLMRFIGASQLRELGRSLKPGTARAFFNGGDMFRISRVMDQSTRSRIRTALSTSAPPFTLFGGLRPYFRSLDFICLSRDH